METLNVYYAVNELGNGHAYRTIKVSEQLIERGHTVTFFTSHPAIQRRFGDSCKIYKCPPVSWYEDRNGINVPLSVLNIFFPMTAYDYESNRWYIKSSSASKTMSRYYDIRSFARKERPDVVVTDGDLLMARWAQRRGIRTVNITNETRPYYNLIEQLFLQPGQYIAEQKFKSSKILVPDIKKPYTICELNLRGMLRADTDTGAGIGADIELVGSYFRTNEKPRDENFIYFSISGSFGTRNKLENRFLPELYDFGCEVVASLGDEKRSATQRGSVAKHGWLNSDERIRCMRDASIIIHSASHNTSMETLSYGKPSVCIPTQPEQRGNAKKLELLGCAVVVEDPKRLKDAIRKIGDDYDFYRSHAEKIGRMVNSADGVARTVEIIENSS